MPPSPKTNQEQELAAESQRQGEVAEAGCDAEEGRVLEEMERDLTMLRGALREVRHIKVWMMMMMMICVHKWMDGFGLTSASLPFMPRSFRLTTSGGDSRSARPRWKKEASRTHGHGCSVNR